MAEFTTPDNVRDYLQASATTGQWSDAFIGSNIAAASANLQRWTHRQFEPQGSNFLVTKTMTTFGRSYLVIPDCRSIEAVRLNGSELVADESYYLQPDRMQSGVFIGIEFPNRQSFVRNYDWFDRGYDLHDFQSRLQTGLPNDLELDSREWGHVPYPAELLHATNALAAFYTIRPDALLSGARQTPEGNVFDLSRLPLEVQGFINDWKLSDPQVVAL